MIWGPYPDKAGLPLFGATRLLAFILEALKKTLEGWSLQTSLRICKNGEKS
jgi:hypothetical protein